VWGPADALRVKQQPMPVKGTWGLVAFPYGDDRNGVWLCSFYSNLQDAYTNPLDPNAEYDAHWSGTWSLLDGLGQYAKSFPDGTYVVLGEEPGLPAPTRNVVNSRQVRESTPYTAADRVSAVPSPRALRVHHASGTEINIDTSGNTSVTGASGASLSFNFGGTLVTVNSSGQVSIAMPGSENFKVSNDGNPATDALVLVSKFLSEFNTHTHTAQGATAVTTVPNVPLTTSNVDSTVVGVSG
jgi:hypothetical protein